MKLYKLLMISLVIFTIGCTAKVYNVEKKPVPETTKASAETVRKAIVAGAEQQGWTLTEKQRTHQGGMFEAVYSRGEHLAAVEIPYTANDYSIYRKDSAGFEYSPDKNTIRRHYNWWVDHLDAKIYQHLLAEIK